VDDIGVHRKRIRHFHELGVCHELTFSCYQRRPLLKDSFLCDLLSEAIDVATEKQRYLLLAHVFMPEHVHLLVYPQDEGYQINRFLYAVKRPFSARAKKYLSRTKAVLVRELTVRARPGKVSFRFWQEGPGYDRNIRSESTLLHAIKYIHNNPVRRGLCDYPDDWVWSSWLDYHSPFDIRRNRSPKVTLVEPRI